MPMPMEAIKLTTPALILAYDGDRSKPLGEVGQATIFKDSFGQVIRVGDLLEITHIHIQHVSNNIVCMEFTKQYPEREYGYAMGYAGAFPHYPHMFGLEYTVKVIKSYTELREGDVDPSGHVVALKKRN